ncbi:citrate/2-methylcitrate synthase [Clostridium sp. 19966]|uniref:citrate/2-methylcitrate synthase n=1 Tax=Clostridium sp. 19966 TaxID=2768166 RepID=UPI0028DE2798|nr:citrate/2-methylcitrate synthase [Clostridium sp. 19966]MDT8717320.1 citrate/2-methylcitrate synthase [Clostridium sp. 19966]
MEDKLYLEKIKYYSDLAEKNNFIDQEYYSAYNVKRGLRNSNGTGVLVGLTKIGNVHGYIIDEGEKIPIEGKLTYRGIDIKDIAAGFQNEKRFGYEEVCYLLLFGVLPNAEELKEFKEILGKNRKLPYGFVEDMILKAPSNDIMNKLMRSILVSYSYDKNPDDVSVKNVLRQSIELIAQFPSMVAYAYQAKAHYYDNKSLFIHSPQEELSTAENILFMIRPDNKYTSIEAEILDLALVIHAEHGGGNNSAFSTHVVSSTGTDTYSAIAAAVGALKGPKHGGANIKVMAMMDYIKSRLEDWGNKAQIENVLKDILDKGSFDGSGLIYGMGHAIYTISDPRAQLLKEKAAILAKEKNRLEEFNLYKTIEETSISIFKERQNRSIAANVDFYSGFVYDMLNIPREVYTPIFAVARVAGWCAHRIEQLVSEPKIIRPAYKNVSRREKYKNINDR